MHEAARTPDAHQLINIGYDALLVFDAAYFWTTGPRSTGALYLASVAGIPVDFAMHFVIRIA